MTNTLNRQKTELSRGDDCCSIAFSLCPVVERFSSRQWPPHRGLPQQFLCSRCRLPRRCFRGPFSLVLYCPTINQLLPADRQGRTFAFGGSFRKFTVCVRPTDFSQMDLFALNGPTFANKFSDEKLYTRRSNPPSWRQTG